MPNKLKCPKCSKSDYSIQNQGGSVTTFLHCKSCGYKGTKEAWTGQQKDKSASSNPFYKKSEKIISMWTHPEYKNKIFKKVEGPDGMQFSDDRGDTWMFTMRTPEEIEQMGFIKVVSEKTEDEKDRQEMELMGFDDELDWEDFKNHFSKNNPFYKKSEKDEYDHPYNKMYPDTGPWNTCKCGQDYQVGISGDSRFCEACLMQESMKNRIRSKKSPLAKNNSYYKLSQSTSVGDDKRPASDKPEKKNDPEINNQRGFNKKPRKNPERAFDAKQDPDEVRRVSMSNPFYSIAKKDKEKYRTDDEKTYFEEGLGPAIENKNKKEKKTSSSAGGPKGPKGPSGLKGDKGPESSNCKKEDKKMKGPKGPKNPDMVDPVKASRNPFYKKSNEFKRNPSKEQEAVILLDELIQAIDETRDFNSLDMRGTILSRLKSIRELVKADEAEEQVESFPFGDGELPSNFDKIFGSFKRKGLDDKAAAKETVKKIAREFGERSEHGKIMKQISDKNMTFIEEPPKDEESNAKRKEKNAYGHQNDVQASSNPFYQKKAQSKNKEKSKSSTKSKVSSNLDAEVNPSFDFNTVDRKEYRSSPKPWDFDPGYKDWYDREIDEYYDGWLDDHIENAGGSIPGSNTEKTMNLNDGERAHAPEYPTEAIYEKLLESRHEFNDDYVRVVAKGKTYVFKRAEAEAIIQAGEGKKKILKKKSSTLGLHTVPM